MNNSVRQELELLSENFAEVLTATEAVKGTLFAHSVAINFEASQLVDIIGCLVDVAPEDMSERVDGLREAAVRVIASILAKACHGLKDGEIKEVIKMADTLHERRIQASEKIFKGLDENQG